MTTKKDNAETVPYKRGTTGGELNNKNDNAWLTTVVILVLLALGGLVHNEFFSKKTHWNPGQGSDVVKQETPAPSPTDGWIIMDTCIGQQCNWTQVYPTKAEAEIAAGGTDPGSCKAVFERKRAAQYCSNPPP